MQPEIAKEQQWHRLLLKRDERVVGVLYRRYGPALLGVIGKIIPSQELAEEVLQDVFLKIWERSTQYDPRRGRLFPWMVRIARNQALDIVRTEHYRKQTELDDMPTVPDPEDPLREEAVVTGIALKKATSQLEEKYRVLIDYLYFQDYSQTEAARVLHLPLGTIKSRARRALRKLRNLMGE